MKIVSSLLAAAAVSVLLTSAAEAAPIIWIDDSNGGIGTVDVATGNSTFIGNSGAGLTDIAFDPLQNLWGISFNSLYTINQGTGAASLVGGFGITDGINGLTFSSSGILYGSSLGGNLYTISTATGLASLIGSVGFASAGDLAFHNGTLYESVNFNGSSLVSVNTGTGAGTLIGQIVADPALFGLVQGSNGLLYGVDGTNVYTVNTTTGLGTLVTGYGGSALAGAYGAASRREAAPAPEPVTIMLFGAGLVGAASLRRRK